MGGPADADRAAGRRSIRGCAADQQARHRSESRAACIHSQWYVVGSAQCWRARVRSCFISIQSAGPCIVYYTYFYLFYIIPYFLLGNPATKFARLTSLHLGKLPSRDPSGALVRRSRSIAVGCAALGGPWVGRSAASRRHTHGSVGRSVDMLQSRNTADFYFRCACTYLRYDCMNTFWPKIGAAMDVPPADRRERTHHGARARAAPPCSAAVRRSVGR